MVVDDEVIHGAGKEWIKKNANPVPKSSGSQTLECTKFNTARNRKPDLLK
jgi:hypothetical protein